LVKPLQGFRHIAARVSEQLHKHVQQLLKFRFALLVRIVFIKMMPYHDT